MSFEVYFEASKSEASDIVRIVSECSSIDENLWVLHSCYLRAIRSTTEKEVNLRVREAALDHNDALSQPINIRDFVEELDGVGIDEMLLIGYNEMPSDLTRAEEPWSSALLSIEVYDGIYWSLSSADVELLKSIQASLKSQLADVRVLQDVDGKSEPGLALKAFLRKSYRKMRMPFYCAITILFLCLFCLYFWKWARVAYKILGLDHVFGTVEF